MAGRLRVIAQRLLESKKPKDRRTALIELYGFEPRERDLPDLYWALRQSYPDEPDRGCETRCTLLAILKEIPSPATVKFLQELYPTLPRQRSILESVLVAFTAINSEQALRAMSRVLLQAGMDLGSPMDSWLLLLPVIKDPKNAAAMFPDVLCLLSNRTYRIGLYGVAAVALNAGILKADQLRPMRGRMLGDFREGQRRYAKMKLQGKELAEPVLLLAAIVTVMRAGSDLPEIHKAIRSAVDHDSAYVAFSAYRTCRKLGWEIEPGAIERLAADPSTRLDLFEDLEWTGQGSQFPLKWRTQESFAEGDMVRWLAVECNFRHAAHKIQLVETRTVRLLGRQGRIYVYKYKYPWLTREWLIGISGPQPLDVRQMVTAGAGTFSRNSSIRHSAVAEHLQLMEHEMRSRLAEARREGKTAR